MSYLDIAIIAIVALGALIGLWKGFFKTLISFFGWFVSFLVAFFITKPIVSALYDVKSIRTFVVGNGESWSLFSWIYAKLPDLNGTGVLATLLKPLSKIVESVGGVDLSTGVALLIANGIFSVGVCICLFIIIRLLLLLFTMFANAMTENKFVGALNRLLGLVMGAVKGAWFVGIVMLILTFFMGMSFMSPVRAQVDKSVLAEPIYNQMVKLTDKFITGGDSTLIKLLDIYERNNSTGNKGTGEAKEEHGMYTSYGMDEYELENYSIELKPNYTFTQYSGSTQRTGTYTLTENTLTLTFDDDNKKYECEYSADGWFKLGEVYMCKDGVTPPVKEEHGMYTSYGLEQYELEDFTIELKPNYTFTQYSGNSERTGTYTLEDNVLTLTFTKNEKCECEYSSDGWFKLDGIYMCKEGVTPPEEQEEEEVEGEGEQEELLLAA